MFRISVVVLRCVPLLSSPLLSSPLHCTTELEAVRLGGLLILFVSYFQVFQMSAITRVPGLQL